MIHKRKLPQGMSYMYKPIFDVCWCKDTKEMKLHNFKKEWKKYGIKPEFSITTNHADKSEGDTCFDLIITCGYFLFNYTNFAWGK